jgi:hypothetical protein
MSPQSPDAYGRSAEDIAFGVITFESGKQPGACEFEQLRSASRFGYPVYLTSVS